MTELSVFQIGAWLLCGLLSVIAIRLLIRTAWLVPWLKGNLIILLLVAAGLAGSLAIDLRGYRYLPQEETLARISFVEFKPQVYIAKLTIPGREDQNFEIRGDQWQLDARLIAWKGAAQTMGLKPVYRLGRLAGRFLTLQQERDEKHSTHELGSSKFAVDTWWLLHSVHTVLPWIRPQYGKAVYMPMAHDAQYLITFSGSALVATPVSGSATSVSQN